MTSTLKYMPILAGALALAGWASTADAQTVLNMGGSSAARNFMTDIPLNLCDAAPTPDRFASADGNKITWTCNRGGSPAILRYSATGSSDGVNKLLTPLANPASNMLFLDHTLTAGCTGPVLTTRPSDGKQYNNTTGCGNGNTISLPVNMGASDVAGSSFHQTGPTGTSVTPLNDGSLTVAPTAVVPFSLFVGKGVVRDVAGAPAGQISGLSRLEVEAIFSRGVTDWKRLGFGTVTDAAPGTLEATSPIVLCLRNAGSGTKAAFDETLMVNAPEWSVALAGSVIFSSSTSGVLSCVAANRRSIGYMDADQIVSFNAGGANAGLGYSIKIDGGKAHDPALGSTNEKRDLKCGKYAYWVSLRLNRRPADAGTPSDTLAQAFIANAGLASTISVIPTGEYWASDEEMAVSKNSDRGPILWKAGNHPECR